MFGCLAGLAVLMSGVTSRAAEIPSPAAVPDWTALRSFAIQLQNGAPRELAASPFQMIVMDVNRDGTDETSYQRSDIDEIRAGGPGGPKVVLAYLSVGEAENYRSYWQKAWNAHPPEWMGPENPEWKGNFKVRFWEPPWQQLMEKAVDHLIDLGYDGAFLDVVDAGEFWADEDRGTARHASAERDMVDFVKSLAAYAHKRNPHFGLFPNGGENLGRFDDYVAAVTGLFREDIWYDGNHLNSASDLDDTLRALKRFSAAKKPIFAIDYVTKPALIDDFYAKAHQAGMVPYATVRALDKLTINPGHDR